MPVYYICVSECVRACVCVCMCMYGCVCLCARARECVCVCANYYINILIITDTAFE